MPERRDFARQLVARAGRQHDAAAHLAEGILRQRAEHLARISRHGVAAHPHGEAAMAAIEQGQRGRAGVE
jgi:hypothetical protein